MHVVVVDWLSARMAEGDARVYGTWVNIEDAHRFADRFYNSHEGRVRVSVERLGWGGDN